MTALMMVHPTDTGDQTFAHCEECADFEALGITIHATDDVAEEFLAVWEGTHLCGDLNTTGLLLFGAHEEIARAYGLPLEL